MIVAMLDKNAVRKIAQRYADEVRKHLQPNVIVLFGSHVNGNPHKWSDIDIAVIFDDYNGNWIETATQLCLLTEEISIDIEPHLLDKTCDKSGFLSHVMKTGEVIYKAA